MRSDGAHPWLGACEVSRCTGLCCSGSSPSLWVYSIEHEQLQCAEGAHEPRSYAGTGTQGNVYLTFSCYHTSKLAAHLSWDRCQFTRLKAEECEVHMSDKRMPVCACADPVLILDRTGHMLAGACTSYVTVGMLTLSCSWKGPSEVRNVASLMSPASCTNRPLAGI